MRKVLLIMPLSTLNRGEKNAGGVDSVCQMLVEYLIMRKSSDLNYRILAFDPFCAEPYLGKAVKLSEFIEVVTCPMNEKRLGVSIPGVVSTQLRVREQIRDFKPDLVHAHQASWLLGVSSKQKRIATLHTYKKIGRKPVSFANDFFYVRIMPRLAGIFIDSYTCVGQLLKDVVKNDTSKDIHVIGNPIDPAFFTSRPNNNETALRMVTCALITRRKRIDRAISFVSELNNLGHKASLTIIGPNSDRVYFEELKQQIEEVGLQDNVFFAGHLSQKEIINEYQQANLGVFFSEEETFGLVPLEMLATGLPLVSTEVGVLAEEKVFFDSIGVFFVSKNESFKNMPLALSRIGQKRTFTTKHLREKFSVGGVVNAYEKLYAEYI